MLNVVLVINPFYTTWRATEIKVYPCLQPNLNDDLALAVRMSLLDSVLHNLQREQLSSSHHKVMHCFALTYGFNTHKK